MIALPRSTFVACLLAALAGFAPTVSAQEVTLTAPGASDDLVERLRANSLLVRLPSDEQTPTSQDVVAAARADYGRLIGTLYEQGFFAPVIIIRLDGRDAAQISPFANPPPIQRAEITIQTGPEFQLGQTSIGPLAGNTELPDGFAPGERATTPLLRATTEAALDGWRMRGYATADVASQRITGRNREAIMDVAISIASGPQVRFGDLRIVGAERMRQSRIIEIAGLPTGEIYNPDALARAEERLRDTGVFSAAALELEAPGLGNIADVTATLNEAPLRRLGFGANLSSDDGLELNGYWIHRNLFGGAERLRLDAEISGIRTTDSNPDITASATLTRPATITPDTALEFSFEVGVLDEPNYTIEGVGLEVLLRHQVTNNLSVFGGVGAYYVRLEDTFGAREITRLNLPLGATFDNRDDPVDARSGAYADVTLTPFFPIGGETGVRTTLDLRGYYGFGETRRTRVAGRIQLGSVLGSDILDIAPDDLFFSGGSGTVRGQSYQSLGAIQNGQDAGGRGFLGLSAEVRHDFTDSNLGVVGFADFGYVSADGIGGGNSEWHAGAGFGVRYSTPFGPIRVDLATPVEGPGVGEDLYLYIGIGQAF